MCGKNVISAKRGNSVISVGKQVTSVNGWKHVISANAIAINYLSFNFIFCLQEIDGKALLLLTREMIMSYMGLKLGPAIKLLCFIDELKNKKYT